MGIDIITQCIGDLVVDRHDALLELGDICYA